MRWTVSTLNMEVVVAEAEACRPYFSPACVLVDATHIADFGTKTLRGVVAIPAIVLC